MGVAKEGKEEGSVAGIVLAGGQGTRLFPLTQSRCKPAVGFGGKYRLIDIPLSNSLNSNVTTLFVISQYFASHLNQHILSTYHLDPFKAGGIKLLSPEENPQGKVWFEGTADAVRQNLKHILKSSAEYFLILSGDQLYNIDFRDMIDFAKKKQADLVVASLCVEEKEATRMGVLKIDQSSRILSFYEKPKERDILNQFCLSKEGKTVYLASMGIYIFKREALISLVTEKGNDFGHDLIPIQVKRGKSFAYEYDGYWVDIGTISSFYEANMALLNQRHCLNTYDEQNPIYTYPAHLPSPIIRQTVIKDSIISQGAIIEAEEILNTVVGVRCRIQEGTKIKDSILMGNHPYTQRGASLEVSQQVCSIGKNCRIERAIIDEHAQIGDHVSLINKMNVQHWDGEGICIRDGIIIVTSGTKIPDHFQLP